MRIKVKCIKAGDATDINGDKFYFAVFGNMPPLKVLPESGAVIDATVQSREPLEYESCKYYDIDVHEGRIVVGKA